jgi:hypothetical protein
MTLGEGSFMKENHPTIKTLVLGILCAGGIAGCITTTPQQPMMYPLVIPIYPGATYGQPQAMPVNPPMMPQQQMAAMPPSPVIYPTPTDYQHLAQNSSEYHQPSANDYRQVANMNSQPSAPYPSQSAAPVSMSLGQQIPSIPVQGIVSVPSHTSQMTQTQRFQMADALFRYLDQDLSSVTKDLAEVMQPTLEASACGIPWLPEMAARNTKSAESRAIVPFRNTPHHTSSTCLNVAQVDNWRIAQRGHIAFRVIFESPESHEKSSRRFELVHERDGWHYVAMNELF